MTNYEKIMRDMTPETPGTIELENWMKSIITNPCFTCVYREKEDCLFRCIDGNGIEKWLNQEERS